MMQPEGDEPLPVTEPGDKECKERPSDREESQYAYEVKGMGELKGKLQLRESKEGLCVRAGIVSVGSSGDDARCLARRTNKPLS